MPKYGLWEHFSPKEGKMRNQRGRKSYKGFVSKDGNLMNFVKMGKRAVQCVNVLSFHRRRKTQSSPQRRSSPGS